MNFIAVLESTFLISAIFYTVYLSSFFRIFVSKKNRNINPLSANSISEDYISVLICAKNEAKNLADNLPSVLTQQHPNFEVIVINDQSTDETFFVLQDFQKEFTNLSVFTTEGKSNKKKAVQLAKDKAKGNIFVFTDADCQIASNEWLKKIQQCFNKKTQVVLGYGPIFKKNTCLNVLQRFETLTTALQYFTSAAFNSAYMGVGRNLAYTKNINRLVELTEEENKLLSGDDDLWIQHAKNIGEIEILTSPETFAYSHGEKSFKKWWNQKRRHITTANHYQFKDQILLSGIFLTKLYFWWYSILILIFGFSEFPITSFTIVICLIYIVYAIASSKFKEPNIWVLSPILDFFIICFQLCLFISNLVSPIRKWK